MSADWLGGWIYPEGKIIIPKDYILRIRAAYGWGLAYQASSINLPHQFHTLEPALKNPGARRTLAIRLLIKDNAYGYYKNLNRKNLCGISNLSTYSAEFGKWVQDEVEVSEYTFGFSGTSQPTHDLPARIEPRSSRSFKSSARTSEELLNDIVTFGLEQVWTLTHSKHCLLFHNRCDGAFEPSEAYPSQLYCVCLLSHGPEVAARLKAAVSAKKAQKGPRLRQWSC